MWRGIYDDRKSCGRQEKIFVLVVVVLAYYTPLLSFALVYKMDAASKL